MKGREVLGRPAPLWILAVLGTIGGLLSTIVAMQFAEVIPWAGDEASYIGGRWTGVVMYGVAALFFFAAAYAWLTVKPWAHMVSILAAIIGFFVPFMSYMDGTDPRSSAIAAIVPSVLMLFMVFRPATNRAMAAALSGQGTAKTAKTPPPPKPMSAARKRELAAEQKTAKSQAPAPVAAPPAPASSDESGDTRGRDGSPCDPGEDSRVDGLVRRVVLESGCRHPGLAEKRRDLHGPRGIDQDVVPAGRSGITGATDRPASCPGRHSGPAGQPVPPARISRRRS